jgi:hypothetical protein
MRGNEYHIRCPILSLALTLRWHRRVLFLAATAPGRITILAIIPVDGCRLWLGAIMHIIARYRVLRERVRGRMGRRTEGRGGVKAERGVEPRIILIVSAILKPLVRKISRTPHWQSERWARTRANGSWRTSSEGACGGWSGVGSPYSVA